MRGYYKFFSTLVLGGIELIFFLLGTLEISQCVVIVGIVHHLFLLGFIPGSPLSPHPLTSLFIIVMILYH